MSLQRWCLRTLFLLPSCASTKFRDHWRSTWKEGERKKFIIKEATRVLTLALLKVLIETLTFQSNGSKMIQRERLRRWDAVRARKGTDRFIRSCDWMDFCARVGFLWKSLSEINGQASEGNDLKDSSKALIANCRKASFTEFGSNRTNSRNLAEIFISQGSTFNQISSATDS